jgi:Prealbumin-like fold domain
MPAQRKTNQSRRLTAAGIIAVTAATMLMMAWAIFPTAAFATVLWDGNGVTNDGQFNNSDCDQDPSPHIFWIFTGDPGPGLTDVTLTVNGQTFDMDKAGGGNSAWQGTSSFFPLNSITASVDGVGGVLTISHGCTGETQARIEIQKQTVPDGDPATFTFTGEISTTLGDGQVSGKDVEPGTYTVSETALAGWNLTDITCNDANSTDTGSTATFHVEEGETVRCVFTNTKNATTTTTHGGGGGGQTTTTPPPAPTTPPTVAPTTIHKSTTTTDEVLPTTVTPSGTAFTGVENVVPIGTIALILMTSGSGLLWAGSRRRRHDGSKDED